MRLIKELGPNGNYRYVMAASQDSTDLDARLKKIFKECVLSYDLAQNILVIKTLPGLAQAAGSTLDGMDIPGLVGTIAGDDTAFLALKDPDAAVKLYHEIEQLL